MEGTQQSPIMEAGAMRLFPTVVWRAEIRPDACRRINEAIVAIAALRRGTANPAAGRGWQSGHDLHELHEFRELTESIGVTVRDVLDYLRIGEVAFEMSDCWANMNAPGAAHGLHSHPNNFLSGVYYVRVPNGGDNINFHDPRIQTGFCGRPSSSSPPIIPTRWSCGWARARSCCSRRGCRIRWTPTAAIETGSA